MLVLVWVLMKIVKYRYMVQIDNECKPRCGQVLYEILFLMKNGLCSWLGQIITSAKGVGWLAYLFLKRS